MSTDKKIILVHPDADQKPVEYSMTIAKAEKMLSCRTTSKKWKFKDDKIKKTAKDGKVTIQVNG